MKIGQDGWFQDAAVIRVPSPKRTCQLIGGVPKGLVWHYTGGRGGHGTHADSVALAKSIADFVPGTDRAASWHILIDKDGTVIQSVPVVLGAWHVGRAGKIGGVYYKNINSCTIGIELENAGELRKAAGKFYTWPYFNLDSTGVAQPSKGPNPKLEVEAERAVAHEDTFFDSFPDEQVAAAEQVCGALADRFDWGRDVCGYGHVMFAEGVKVDPGPCWIGGIQEPLLDRVFATR